MATEIERKFLPCSDAWREAEALYFCQGYLNHDKHRTVRVRVVGESGTLTIKGLTQGVERLEFDYPIPVADAKALLELCDQPLIEKYRREIPFGQHLWEVDEFLGENAGLVVAEIELSGVDEAFEKPDWVGPEVSDDPKYFNSSLSKHPYSRW
ncbi:MAG: CYTH domain-containing protein [Granulosicoccaceae bacterium]